MECEDAGEVRVRTTTTKVMSSPAPLPALTLRVEPGPADLERSLRLSQSLSADDVDQGVCGRNMGPSAADLLAHSRAQPSAMNWHLSQPQASTAVRSLAGRYGLAPPSPEAPRLSITESQVEAFNQREPQYGVSVENRRLIEEHRMIIEALLKYEGTYSRIGVL
jgi:hypothetical protein